MQTEMSCNIVELKLEVDLIIITRELFPGDPHGMRCKIAFGGIPRAPFPSI
uniref:Shikimate O-hydroxycinnamoyltransferase-like n=1 Tax=Rhizophora mucronata TaxID=61149 RepID=A0A2P2P8C9_RHIMU